MSMRNIHYQKKVINCVQVIKQRKPHALQVQTTLWLFIRLQVIELGENTSQLAH